jgi:hypothetical protein
MAGLYGNTGNPAGLGGKITTGDLLANTGIKAALTSATESSVSLSGYFGFAFDDPFLLHRGYWQDSKKWVDAGIFKDKLY